MLGINNIWESELLFIKKIGVDDFSTTFTKIIYLMVMLSQLKYQDMNWKLNQTNLNHLAMHTYHIITKLAKKSRHDTYK